MTFSERTTLLICLLPDAEIEALYARESNDETLKHFRMTSGTGRVRGV